MARPSLARFKIESRRKRKTEFGSGDFIPMPLRGKRKPVSERISCCGLRREPVSRQRLSRDGGGMRRRDPESGTGMRI